MMQDSKKGNGLFCRFTVLLKQILMLRPPVLEQAPLLEN